MIGQNFDHEIEGRQICLLTFWDVVPLGNEFVEERIENLQSAMEGPEDPKEGWLGHGSTKCYAERMKIDVEGSFKLKAVQVGPDLQNGASGSPRSAVVHI
jgi:hypothetical protein